MELEEVDRIVIAKPVASRPTCSRFRSFSELLAGAISASPSTANVCSEMAVAAIRPKTVRVKSAMNRASLCMISQAEASGAARCSSSDNVAKLENQSTMIFRPLAKVVSKATVSLLASMGNSDITHQPALSQVDPYVLHLNQNKLDVISNPDASNPLVELSQSIEPPKVANQMLEEEPKMTAASSANVDRPSYDGYNWRKYGQKQVKGSEYPRSYYKCTHPNCPVKKKVERSFDGQIAEIVYKGEHNHPKPQPPKRSSSGVQGQCSAIEETGQDHGNNKPKAGEDICERNEVLEGRLENEHGVEFSNQSIFPGKSPRLRNDLPNMRKLNASGGTPEDAAGISGDYEKVAKGLEFDNEPKRKRRKHDNKNTEAGGRSGEGVREPRIWVQQNNTEPEVLGDGFRWRKYGQKVVKGNPYPRSYYRCTSLKCNVRKHVERASDDPRSFITTYEGRHNHDMPVNTEAPTTEDKQ